MPFPKSRGMVFILKILSLTSGDTMNFVLQIFDQLASKHDIRGGSPSSLGYQEDDLRLAQDEMGHGVQP